MNGLRVNEGFFAEEDNEIINFSMISSGKNTQNSENTHFCHPEHFRGLKPLVWKYSKQKHWHSPCYKHSDYSESQL